MTNRTITHRTILVCQHNACRKAGAIQVLAALENLPLPEVTVEPVRCLGQCGNGPMVLVLPDRVWYSQVHPNEVPAVVERHLRNNRPVQAMLYRRFHSKSFGNLP